MWVKLTYTPDGHGVSIAMTERLTEVRINYNGVEPAVEFQGKVYIPWKIVRSGADAVYTFEKDCPVQVLALMVRDGIWIKVCQ